jgi:hypothetical protein
MNQIEALTTLELPIFPALSILFRMYSKMNLINTTKEVMKLVTTIVPIYFRPARTERFVAPFSDLNVL